MPTHEEIKAARAILTDDRIVELKQGLVNPGLITKLMLEAAERVRSPNSNSPTEAAPVHDAR